GGDAGAVASDPRGGAPETEHAAVGVEGFAAIDLGAAADGAGEADEAGTRRAGLDRDEGAGEGPQPPLRDRQRVCEGRAALAGGRARAGVPAVSRLSAAQVRATAPGGSAGDGGGAAGRAAGCCGRRLGVVGPGRTAGGDGPGGERGPGPGRAVGRP